MFMVTLDAQIVILAAPATEAELGFSAGSRAGFAAAAIFSLLGMIVAFVLLHPRR